MKPGFLNMREKKACFLAFTITVLLPLILEAGCNGGGGGENDTISRKIFVTSPDGNKISVFEADASDNAVPIRTIGSNVGLFGPQGIFVDTEKNLIFVANFLSNTITVYERTAKGDALPLKTIGGPDTKLSFPRGIFVDKENDEIFVTNQNNTITVYENAMTAGGNVSPSRIIKGLDTGLSLPFGIFVDSEHSEIFVTNSRFDFENGTHTLYITVYENAVTADGNVLPSRTLFILDSNSTGFQELRMVSGIFVDLVNDKLFVADSTFPAFLLPFRVQRPIKSTLRIYRREAKENEPPLRIIEGEKTGLFTPFGISVDTEHNEIFITNSFNNTVTVYDEMTAGGDALPLRILSILDSNNAGVSVERDVQPWIFVDVKNNEIFISNLNNTITVYRRTAKENDPPLRILGDQTGLLRPQWIHVDKENDEIFVSNFLSGLITVYEVTDYGNVSPLRTIPQGFLTPKGVFVDTKHNEIFVVANSREFGVVTVYRRTDSELLRTISGLNTELFGPEGISVDEEYDEIFVANARSDTITVYERTANGDNDSPVRVIEGENTKLSFPRGIFLDKENDEIFVANSGSDRITVYERTADGDDDSPKRIIEGENTELSAPTGIFVDTELDKIFVANSESNKITVYERIADGDDDSPVRIMELEGENTFLNSTGIFLAESP